MHTPDRTNWRRALGYAVPVWALVLSLFGYWFGVADRYAVFLYGHLGATPFDAVTRSRYWMAGLVASGLVLVGYVFANWLLGRLRDHNPPAWWQVWLLCVPPLAVGIPLIVMTLNSPTLPPLLAGACAVAALIGLALALMPGRWAAQRPLDLVWLVADGMGLVPGLLLLRAVELPGRGLNVGAGLALGVAAGGVVGGALWLLVMTGLRAWRHRPAPKAGTLLAAGLALSYLALPLVHHLVFTPWPYRYISTASNFFAFSLWLQALSFLVAVGLAVGATWVRAHVQSPPSDGS